MIQLVKFFLMLFWAWLQGPREPGGAKMALPADIQQKLDEAQAALEVSKQKDAAVQSANAAVQSATNVQTAAVGEASTAKADKDTKANVALDALRDFFGLPATPPAPPAPPSPPL